MVKSDSDERLSYSEMEIGGESSVVDSIREWILVDADRLNLAVYMSINIYFFLLLLHGIDVIGFENDDSLTRMAGGMIAGTFSIVTLVVSINQLILSRDFASLEELKNRLDNVLELRSTIENETRVTTTPAEPSEILRVCVLNIQQCANDFQEEITDNDDEVQKIVSEFVNDIDDNTDRVISSLESTEFGTFEALGSAIEYNDSWHIFLARHIRNKYSTSLSDAALQSLEDLLDALELFYVVLSFFKTTYLQRELTQFSREMIYFGVPAVLSAILVGLLYADITGPAIPNTYLPYISSGLIAIVISPLFLLSSYVLRTATIAHRTASIGPMIPQKDPDSGPVDISIDLK